MRNENRIFMENEMLDDYIFRYKLDLEVSETPVHNHRLAEFVRVVLENVLNIIVPLKDGEDIKIDGFRWMMDRENKYEIFSKYGDITLDKYSSHKAESAQHSNIEDAPAFYEPRIVLIKKLIKSLLNLIELENNGHVVNIDSFRLKNLRDWIINSSGDPNEILQYLGSRCSCDCVFCCNNGNPPVLKATTCVKSNSDKEFNQLNTRVKYFSERNKTALFPSGGSVYEITEHPHFMHVLQKLRGVTSSVIRITSNGRNLTPEFIEQLTQFKPLYVYLSLNSSSPGRRYRLMKDNQPEIAIASLNLLKKKSIPYATVIVPWPLDNEREMLDDLVNTIKYATQYETHLIQINLPGYTRYFSQQELFDSPVIWKQIISRARSMREIIDNPIIVMPTMYEEILYCDQINLAQVVGLVKNSPASLGGIRRGDVITNIGGIPVRNRPQARDLLSMFTRDNCGEVSLSIRRNNQNNQVKINPHEYDYPYSKEVDSYYGVVFMGSGFRIKYIEDLKKIVETHQANRVLFLSSKLVKPFFEQCLSESHLFDGTDIEIHIEVPENKFFGGNILIGDLLVVQDFIDCIEQYLNNAKHHPDLIVIPSSPFSLSGWGRDLTGRIYLDIERATGIPVEILHCTPIYN